MTIQDALDLAAIIASGKYNPDELKRFLDFLEDTDFIKRDQVLDAYYEAIDQQKSYGSYVEPEFMNRLKALKPQREEALPEVFELKEVRTINWKRISAAAALLAVLATSSYFFFFNKPKQEIAQTQQTYKNDIAPGGNKAILTLSNGSKIILDSAHIGKLAKQGNTNIQKLDSGMLAYTTLMEKPTEVLYNTLSTPRGGQYQLTLADGSQVWLNSASSIKYPTAFSGNQRNVEITGEAYFEVTKDKNKPFSVTINDMNVEVLGTHFNVNGFNDESAIKTTLLEGAVKITKGTNAVLLNPGQQGILNAEGNLTKTNDVDLDKVMAWKNGWFEFDQTDLTTIMRQVSRWYDLDISYEGNLKDDKFGGRVNKNVPLSDILKSLEANGNGVKFKLDGKKLLVQP
jgi:transmembrane sensor